MKVKELINKMGQCDTLEDFEVAEHFLNSYILDALVQAISA